MVSARDCSSCLVRSATSAAGFLDGGLEAGRALAQRLELGDLALGLLARGAGLVEILAQARLDALVLFLVGVELFAQRADDAVVVLLVGVEALAQLCQDSLLLGALELDLLAEGALGALQL